ncbi:hypothetical protein H2201_005314 [Coniosporium apollinis]|uniref:Cytochrome b5 heme-binding domain-containing protein n=1 Tax=Coniosporium apollinis TaxID=61459 RepID=A0ABQ9NT92_9PEZI|nr:hypothetical protein H2201_005314 [Coniosporium apollinis]
MPPKPSPSILQTLRSSTFWTQAAKGIPAIIVAAIIQVSFSQWMNPAPGSEKAVLGKKMGRSFGEAHPRLLAVPRLGRGRVEEVQERGKAETQTWGLEAWGFWMVTGESVAWGYRPWWSRGEQVRAWWNGPIRLTDAQLSVYSGTDPIKPIYVGLNGSIYDVSAGRHFYGPGGSYHFFAGRDAARAFVTGCFEEDLTPDLRGVEEMFIPVDAPEAPELTKAELKNRRARDMKVARRKVRETLEGWAKTFRGESGRPYFLVGEIVREEGWLEKLPRRELCEAAKKSRPKRKQGE